MCRSIEGVENICCGGMCAPALRRLGPWLNTRCGNWMNACAILGMGLSWSTPLLYLTQAPGAALVCAAATKSALACYADQVGVGQGEYLAHQSSLMAVLKILTPFLYSTSFNRFRGTALANMPFLISGSIFIVCDLLMVTTIKDHELNVVTEEEMKLGSETMRPKERGKWAVGLVGFSALLMLSTRVLPPGALYRPGS